MTILASLAWRKRSTSQERASPVPPVVAAMGSGDTASECDSYFRTDSDNVSDRLEPPRTPDGLRPRRSLEAVRDDLQLPSHVLKHLPIPTHFEPPSSSRRATAPFSPPVSNSSFYTRSSFDSLVAESPDLQAAKTAVGALVGQRHGSTSRPSSYPTGISGILPPMPTTARVAASPPRSTWHQPLQYHSGPLSEGEVSTDEDEAEDQPYQRLNDSCEVTTPTRMLRSSSPVSTDASSIRGSVASFFRYDYRQQNEHTDSREVSFSSQRGLVDQFPARYAYNFEPIHGEKETHEQEHDEQHDHFVVATDDHMTNVSAMSHSTMASARDSQASTSPQPYKFDLRHEQHEENLMENALLHRKAQQQRRSKEQLVLEVIQRLQQNIYLIQQVEELRGDDDACFVCTPIDSQGLLTGYSSDSRERLSKYLDSVLYEMDVARPEDFFLSPSQMSGIADNHSDLREALTFFRKLVRQAIPQDECHLMQTWKMKAAIRSSLGVPSTPESPETVRGGDTSLFSLPSECSTTPYTSHVQCQHGNDHHNQAHSIPDNFAISSIN